MFEKIFDLHVPLNQLNLEVVHKHHIHEYEFKCATFYLFIFKSVNLNY